MPAGRGTDVSGGELPVEAGAVVGLGAVGTTTTDVGPGGAACTGGNAGSVVGLAADCAPATSACETVVPPDA